MLPRGWPSHCSQWKVFLFLTFSLKQWGCQCWKHKSITVGICLFVFHYCLSRILLENNRFKCFLGGDSTWVFLFTFSVLSALLVLLSISSYFLARYLSPISFPPLLLFHNLDFLFHPLNFRTAKGVIPRCQLTIFLSVFLKEYPCNQLTNPLPDQRTDRCQVAQKGSWIFKMFLSI